MFLPKYVNDCWLSLLLTRGPTQRREDLCSWRHQHWNPLMSKLLSVKSSQVELQLQVFSVKNNKKVMFVCYFQRSIRRCPAERWPAAPSAPWLCPAPSDRGARRRRSAAAAARAPNRLVPSLKPVHVESTSHVVFFYAQTWRQSRRICWARTQLHSWAVDAQTSLNGIPKYFIHSISCGG